MFASIDNLVLKASESLGVEMKILTRRNLHFEEYSRVVVEIRIFYS